MLGAEEEEQKKKEEEEGEKGRERTTKALLQIPLAAVLMVVTLLMVFPIRVQVLALWLPPLAARRPPVSWVV